MKKALSLLMTVLFIIISILTVPLLTGCGHSAINSANQSDNHLTSSLPGLAGSDDRLSIVTTIFPQYDWVRQILGERLTYVNLTLLLENGVDLHSFQPSVATIAQISACDLLICVGGESESWIYDVLKTAPNENQIVINLIDVLGSSVKAEDLLEGMEPDPAHSHEFEHDGGDTPIYKVEHDDDGDARGSTNANTDEHIWLSLKNAQELCTNISQVIGALDPQFSSTYTDNTQVYNAKLSALDKEFQDLVNNATTDTLLFGDRFPFRYLMEDYGIHSFAAFSGCSTDTEASFETIVFLSGKLDELDLHSVVVTESSDKTLANTIINNSAKKTQDIQVMNSMQAVKKADILSGITYLSIMENNYFALQNALQ